MKPDAYDIKAKIGVVFQDVAVFEELTVYDNIDYFCGLYIKDKKTRKQYIEEAIDLVGLSEFKKFYPKQLSGGLLRRLNIACGIAHKPKLIFLDEPTVGLDPKQITEIRTLIKELGKKHTVILSSHILSEVSQICERVIIINNGKIIAIDTPENLENKTKEKNTIIVTVEDKKENMNSIKEKIAQIEEVKLLKENQDGSKQYSITSAQEVDLRKSLFEVLPKEEITILELKKSESSLEDAFIKLINSDQKEETKQEPEKKKEKSKTKLEKREEKNKQKSEEKKQYEKKKEEKAKKKLENKEQNKKENKGGKE